MKKKTIKLWKTNKTIKSSLYNTLSEITLKWMLKLSKKIFSFFAPMIYSPHTKTNTTIQSQKITNLPKTTTWVKIKKTPQSTLKKPTILKKKSKTWKRKNSFISRSFLIKKNKKSYNLLHKKMMTMKHKKPI